MLTSQPTQTGVFGDIGRNPECGIIDEELKVRSRPASRECSELL